MAEFSENDTGGNSQGWTFPLSIIAASEARFWGHGVPAMQIEMFPRLDRFDVQFDIPDAFIPNFPPAIFLQNRPELGDVSRGEVVSINNFHRLVQGYFNSGPARWFALAGNPVSARRIQRHRRPQNTATESWRVLFRLPRQWPYDGAVSS